MNQARIHELGNGYIAIPLEYGSWRIEKKGAPWDTAKLLQESYWSLQDAQEAYSKFLGGKLKPREGEEVFSDAMRSIHPKA
jgi:hypothetical protein